MFCSNCGNELKETEKICPICQTNNDVVVESVVNDKYEEYKETEKINEKYGFNKFLIFSILEFFCCAQIFGLAAIIFLFFKLKPAIADRNFEEADKWKRVIKIILIVGLTLGIFTVVLQIALEMLPMLVELSETLI